MCRVNVQQSERKHLYSIAVDEIRSNIFRASEFDAYNIVVRCSTKLPKMNAIGWNYCFRRDFSISKPVTRLSLVSISRKHPADVVRRSNPFRMRWRSPDLN